MPKIIVPKIIPSIVPKPPVRTTPPITAAAIASNSFKFPFAVSAVLTSNTWHAANIVAQNAVNINKEILTLSNDKQTAEKGEYKDFMSKEINEQNITAKTCIKEYVDQLRKDINLYNFPINPKDIEKIVLMNQNIGDFGEN